MQMRMKLSVLLLGITLMVSGCSNLPNPSPSIKTEIIQRPVPEVLLQCKGEPLVSDYQILTNKEADEFLEAVRLAGADCRSQIEAVRQYLQEH